MKKILVCLFSAFLFVLSSKAQFVTVWNTNKVARSGEGTLTEKTKITLPVQSGSGAFKGTWIKVGEPTKTGAFTETQDNVIDFKEPGVYEVAISEFDPQTFVFVFNNNGDRLKIVDVKQWGGIVNKTKGMFDGCLNLEVTAKDTPVLGPNISYMFSNCQNLIGTSVFNTWDTKHVTNMMYMFYNAKKFNQPIGNWNTAKVASMRNMFTNASSFNQDLTTNGQKWNVSRVANFNDMFNGANAFNQPGIKTWKFRSTTISMNNFLNAPTGLGMNCLNYGEILKTWAENENLPSGIRFGALNRVRSSAAVEQAYAKLTTNKAWVITDGGYDNDECEKALKNK